MATMIASKQVAFDGIELYVFGSVLAASECINDVDLLVVYEDTTALAAAKSALDDIALRIPLHVTFMLKREERELGFISRQGAKNAFEVWSMGRLPPESTTS